MPFLHTYARPVEQAVLRSLTRRLKPVCGEHKQRYAAELPCAGSGLIGIRAFSGYRQVQIGERRDDRDDVVDVGQTQQRAADAVRARAQIGRGH